MCRTSSVAFEDALTSAHITQRMHSNQGHGGYSPGTKGMVTKGMVTKGMVTKGTVTKARGLCDEPPALPLETPSLVCLQAPPTTSHNFISLVFTA